MSGRIPETVAVPVAEEKLTVTKQDVETARVRVSLKTETLQDVVRETLRGHRVEVERIPIGREVDHVLESRVEDGVVIIPVVEEILVVEKRLVLKEEVRLRYVNTTEAVEYPLTRRSQSAVIERVEAGEADRTRSTLQDLASTKEGEPRMTRTLTGLFDTRQEADAVVEHLLQHDGIDRSHIRVYAVDADTASGYQPADDKGFWASLRDLFVPDDERATYSEGLRRGGVVVSAEVPDQILDHASDVFESHGAVDLDAREAEWRSQGWSGTSEGMMTSGATTSLPQAPAATAGMGTMPTAADMSTSDMSGTARIAGDGSEDVIPIVEEQIRIGKRDMEHGRVRVRSYVVETPVSEDVTLREEHVDVQRRPVDRPVSDADRMFEERTIEATEHGEEAVVAKEARVKEEVVIRKSATEHTQTVKDTVRRTEVDVTDDRTPASSVPHRDPG